MKKAQRDKERDAAWRDAFKSNCTRLSFNLMLSKPMLEYLCATADDVVWDRATHGSSIAFPDNFLGTEHALTRRGLIQRKPLSVIDKMRKAPQCFVQTPCELTPVGKAVVEMLKVGGVFIPAAESLRRMKQRPGRW